MEAGASSGGWSGGGGKQRWLERRRGQAAVAGAVASVVFVVLVGVQSWRALGRRTVAMGAVGGVSGGPQTRLQMLAETSIRTDRAHPYNTMIAAPQEVRYDNRHWVPAHTVNPAPVHPYHAGKRPAKVLHRDFEHAPYGHQLPWEQGPEGALAKYAKRPDEVKQYRFMVDRDGVVKKWTSDLPLSHYSPEDIKVTDAVLDEFSPLLPPQPSARDVARSLAARQEKDIKKSFRNVFPDGMFHDSVMDSRTGKQLPISGISVDKVECPSGLFQCEDQSCVAHISYCPGCDVYPKPDKCAPIQVPAAIRA